MDPSAKVLILISFFFFFLSGTHAGCAPNAGCGPKDACGPAVVQLTNANFDCEVVNNCDPWMVTFGAPWCGYARQLKPEFEIAAKNLQGKAKFGEVNCDVEKEVCGRYGIRSFPTVKAFPGGDKCKPVDYYGPRTACAMEAYVNNGFK